MNLNFNSTFESIADSIINKAVNFTFETSWLPEVGNYDFDIRENQQFSEIFDSLNKMKNHCVYWFSLETNQLCGELNQILDNKRGDLKIRNRLVPAKNKNQDSNVLYVGKRKGGIRKSDDLTNISGRLVQHLGYYEKGSTQGLQLAHWSRDLDYTIALNVSEFEDLPELHLSALEMIMAHELKPLCGRH